MGNQLIRRIWKSLVGKPEKSMEVEIPKFNYDDKKKKYTIEIKKENRRGMSKELKNIEAIQKKLRFRFKGGLKLDALPAYGATVEDIFNIVEDLEYYDNYCPDVIVIDYADIIRPSLGESRFEYRHQLDSIWKKLRGYAHQKNVLLVTATQSTRKGALQDVTEGDVAEDIRKLNHVSKMISINQDKQEHQYNISRVRLIKEREGRKGRDDVVVLQSLDIGKVHLDSRYRKEVDLDSLKKDGE